MLRTFLLQRDPHYHKWGGEECEISQENLANFGIQVSKITQADRNHNLELTLCRHAASSSRGQIAAAF